MEIITCNKNKMVNTIILILIAIFYSAGSSAQDVQFSASAPGVVAVGEQFRLTFTLNRRGSDLRLPDLDNFQLISGPATSSSSSVQIINGQMTQTQSNTYTYVLRATQAGRYTLNPATINVGSDQYSSNSLEIEVVSDASGRRSVPQQPSPGTGQRPSDVSGEDMFVRIMFDKKEVFQGEAVVATVKLFSKLDITGIENVRFPSFSGFFQQEIETPPLRSLDREVIDGVIYGTGVLRQVVLFPQRNGEITIEPFEMDALVRQRTPRRGSLFDDFFGGVETSRIRISSPPFTLKVKPLPDPKPDGFTGAVGTFNMNVDMTPGEVKTNEAVNLKVTISGRGNLHLLGKPEIEFPYGFEVYDPNVRPNIRNSAGGQEGSITWEYLIIPRSRGNFEIPPVRFSYFNPSSGNYRTINSREYNLFVERGDDDGDGSSAGPVTREDVRMLGRDIRFIKTGGMILSRIDDDPFGSFSYYLWFLFPFALFGTLVLFQRKTIREKADISIVKTRRASKIVRRRLKTAGRYMKENNHQEFFGEISKAQWNYLSDKLLIPVAELNKTKAKDALLEKKVPENVTYRFLEIIGDCEFARYAPPSQSPDMNRVYEDTHQIIMSIEQKIKR
jgi:hypothetical protein